MNDFALLRRLWPYLRPDGWVFAVALALTPAAALLSLVQPYLLKRAIDDYIVPGVADGLMTVALIYLGAVVAGYLLQGGYVLALAWGSQRSIVRLRSAIFRHLLQLKIQQSLRDMAKLLPWINLISIRNIKKTLGVSLDRYTNTVYVVDETVLQV